MELKDLKFNTIVSQIQELQTFLPNDAEIWSYGFIFYEPKLPKLTFDFWHTDYDDITKEIKSRIALWKNYSRCEIHLYAHKKSRPFIGIRLTLDFELFEHREIQTTTETVYNLKRKPYEFTGKTPSQLTIRNKKGELIDLEIKTWREILTKFLGYLYLKERKQYNALLKNQNSKLYKISTKEISIPCDGKKKRRYFKMNDRFFYVNYSAESVIRILQDTVNRLGWSPEDVGIKLDYHGKYILDQVNNI